MIESKSGQNAPIVFGMCSDFLRSLTITYPPRIRKMQEVNITVSYSQATNCDIIIHLC